MGGDWPGKYPGWRVLLKLAVAERGTHEQALIAKVAARDGSGSEETEWSAEELAPVRVVLLVGVIEQARELRRHLDTYSPSGPDGFVFVGVKGGQLRRSNF